MKKFKLWIYFMLKLLIGSAVKFYFKCCFKSQIISPVFYEPNSSICFSVCSTFTFVSLRVRAVATVISAHYITFGIYRKIDNKEKLSTIPSFRHLVLNMYKCMETKSVAQW
jgi:hypothetical protein